MNRIVGRYLYAPSDLVNFTLSEFIPWMDQYDWGPPGEIEPDPVSAEQKIIQEKGIEHEHAFLDALSAAATRVCDLSGFKGLSGPTLDAMRRGEEIIYQAYLVNGEFRGATHIAFPHHHLNCDRLAAWCTGMLEAKLANVDSEVLQAIQDVKATTAVLKKLQRSAAAGDLSQLERTTSECRLLAIRVQETMGRIAHILDFDHAAYLASRDYLTELIAAADSMGVHLHDIAGALYGFPVILKVNPKRRSLSIGKTRSEHLRPIAVARTLKKLQAPAGRQGEDRFLEDLYGAYQLITSLSNPEAGPGRVIALSLVYRSLTLRSSVPYSRQDFGIDLYRLDRSGLQTTRDGAQLALPASTGTKDVSETFLVVTEHGQEKRYYGLSFAPARSTEQRDEQSLA